MTNFRERAAQVKAAGVARRGDWTPPQAAQNSYKYWLSESNSKRARKVRMGTERENYCHFWRVVGFWSPMMYLRRKAEKVATHPVTIVLTILAAIAAFITSVVLFGGFREVVLVILAAAVGLALVVGGGIGMASIITCEDDADRERSDFPNFKLSIALAIIGFPGAIVVATVLAVEKFCTKYLSDYGPHIAIAVISSFLIFCFTMGVIQEGWLQTLFVVGCILGFLAAIVAVVAVGFFISDYVDGRRALAKEEHRAWRMSFYERGETPPEEEEPRKRNFFNTIGDVVVFIGQVVRVNKWRACPLVDLDASRD